MASELDNPAYRSDGSWCCLQCTFLNEPGCKRCKICDVAATAAANSSARKEKGCGPKFTAQLPDSCEPLRSTQKCLGKRTKSIFMGVSNNAHADKRMRKNGDVAATRKQSPRDIGELAKVEAALGENFRREKRRAASGPWACPACSFENAWLETTCQICRSPRPSVRSDPEQTLHSDAKERHAQMVRDQQHEYKQKRLEAKHRTSIKTLARLASSSLSPDFVWPLDDATEPTPRCQKAKNKNSSATSMNAPKTKALNARPGRGGPKRPVRLTNTTAGSEAKPRTGPMVGKKRRVSRSCNQKEASTCASKDDFCCSLRPGMLIHYAFQGHKTEWVWYKGMILCGWRSKSAWKKVMFEDGEQLWVLLDRASNGRLWNTIDARDIVKVVNEFEQTLTLVSPESLTSLKSELESILSMEAPLNEDTERCVEGKASNSNCRYNIDVDDELAIEASPTPPSNWSHPPAVNSLEPTEVAKSHPPAVNSLEPTEVTNEDIPIPAPLSTASAPPPPHPLPLAPLPSAKKRKYVKRANKQGISLEARRSNSTRGKHREKETLKTMIKQKLSLVSMGNGEEYALPQSNTSDVYTVPTAISSKSHQRTQFQNRDECEETSKDHWVACDQCQKWRRVSFAVLKNIEASEQRWFCKDNTDDPPLSFCDAEEEVDHTEKGGVYVSLEVPRPAWVLALEEAYTHALAAQLSPSVYKDCDSLAYIKSLVRNAVGLISPPNTKWGEFLQRMDGCRGASQIHAQLRMVIFGCHRTAGPLPAVATPVPQQVPRHKPLPALTGVAEVVPPLFIVPGVSGSGCGKAPYVQSHAQRPLQVLTSQVEAINLDLDTSVNRSELSMSAGSSKMSPEALLQKAVSEEHWRCSEQWRAWHRLQYQKQLLVQQQQGGDFRPEWRTQADVPVQSPHAIGYTNLQHWDPLHPQNYSDTSLFFLRQNPSVVNQPIIYTGAPTPHLDEVTRAYPNGHRGLVPSAPGTPPTLTELRSPSIHSALIQSKSANSRVPRS